MAIALSTIKCTMIKVLAENLKKSILVIGSLNKLCPLCKKSGVVIFTEQGIPHKLCQECFVRKFGFYPEAGYVYVA